MFTLQCSASFDAAHFLKDHPGACRNLHGHRWRVEAEIAGDRLQIAGAARDMLVDFADFKQTLKALAAEFDHKMIYEAGSLKPATLAALHDEGFALVQVPFRPTAERLAQLIFARLADAGFVPLKVQVWETPNNCASYSEQEARI